MSSVEWGAYEPYDPGFASLLGDLSKREARTAFQNLMAAKPARVDEVSTLLRINGVEVRTDDTGLDEICCWFRDHVEGDPQSGRLSPRWYSVVNDLALLLGDTMIGRAPNLHWVMFEGGRRDSAFQRHVIVGFSRVPNPNYRVDIDLLLASYAHRVVAGMECEKSAFRTWVNAAVEKA